MQKTTPFKPPFRPSRICYIRQLHSSPRRFAEEDRSPKNSSGSALDARPGRADRDLTQDLEREFAKPKPLRQSRPQRPTTTAPTRTGSALDGNLNTSKVRRTTSAGPRPGSASGASVFGSLAASLKASRPQQGENGSDGTQKTNNLRKTTPASLPPSSPSRINDLRKLAARTPSRPQQGTKDLRSMSAARPGTVDLRSMKAAAPPVDRSVARPTITRTSTGPPLQPGAVRPALRPRGSVQERSSGPPTGRIGAGRRNSESDEGFGDISTFRREKRTNRRRSLIDDGEAKGEGPQYSEEELAYMKERDAAMEPEETPYTPATITKESLSEYMPAIATGTGGLQNTVQRGFDKMVFHASLGGLVKAPPMEFLSLDEARKRDAYIARQEKKRDSYQPQPLSEQQMNILVGKLLPEAPDVTEQAKGMGGGQVVTKVLQMVNRNPSYTSEDAVALATRFKGLLPGAATARPKSTARAS